MVDTIEIMEKAFTDLSNDKAVMPQRIPITAPDLGGLTLFMPAYLKGMGALGAKIVSVYKDNIAKYDLPTILGTIILLDEKTGAPMALMEGGFLTAMRTGGVAGLASKLLSRPDSKVHALFGAGGMARAHAWAVDTARDIEKLILYSVDPVEKLEAFRNSLKDIIHSEIVLSDSPEKAVNDADIVTLITSSHEPVVHADWIKPGAHVNGIGSHAPGMREIDTKTVQISKVVCDLVEACKQEAGDFIIPIEEGQWSWDQVHGSLGDVVTGKIAGRESNDEITVFKSVGLAIQDMSTALHVFNRAVEMGVGMDFKF
jgi:ornithine cyclodeaminase/alanine dehydrogenase-like protein (mu-crystallin family)